MTAHLRAGDLNRPILIQSRATGQDTFGGQLLTWADVKTVYAKIESLTANEKNVSQAIYADVSHRITIRFDSLFADTKTVGGYRIVYKGRIFDIKGSMNLNEEDRTIELMVSEGVNNG